MNATTDPTIDKSDWGDGPWHTEPDRVEWEHAGLPCLAIRNHYGVWCGYAAVPPGHPWHGTDADAVDVDVHGGVNYAATCQHRDDGIMGICHVPKPGEADNVWWFGFDCGHCWDVTPALDARMRTYGRYIYEIPFRDHSSYKSLEYVQAEVNRLAEQLAAVVPADAQPTTIDPAGSRSTKGVRDGHAR